MGEESLSERWLKQGARPPPPPESDPSLSLDVSAERAGSMGWAVAFGTLGGVGGGAAMLLVARAVALKLHIDADIIGTIGARAAHALAFDPFTGAMLTACVVGGLLGAFFGVLMRHSVRFVARLLAGALLAPVLWTLVQAFVFKTFAPTSLGALPFGPMVAGAAVYGVCVVLLRPPRRRSRALDAFM